MRRCMLFTLLFALLFTSMIALRAMPSLPVTLFSKVQAGGADVLPGTSISAQHKLGETAVISPSGFSSVYALELPGPTDWIPPGEPETEGLPVTVEISDTLATSIPWSMENIIPLTLAVDSLVGDLPCCCPANVELLEQVWDITVDFTGYAADMTCLMGRVG